MAEEPVACYMRHREQWRAAHSGQMSDVWKARLEIVPLALTIADLTEAEQYPNGAYVGWTDPEDLVQDVPEGNGAFWSEEAVRRAIAPSLHTLRNIAQILDAVDAVTLNAGYIAEHVVTASAASADTVIQGLTTHLSNARSKAAEDAGLTREFLEYLRYRYLTLTTRNGAQRQLTVKPGGPWDYASASLAQALTAYSASGVYRHENAAEIILKARREHAKGLPPEHWGW